MTPPPGAPGAVLPWSLNTVEYTCVVNSEVVTKLPQPLKISGAPNWEEDGVSPSANVLAGRACRGVLIRYVFR